VDSTLSLFGFSFEWNGVVKNYLVSLMTVAKWRQKESH
jgi:hypothetical protein